MSETNQINKNKINTKEDKKKKRRITEEDKQIDQSGTEDNHNMNPSSSKQKIDEFNFDEPLNLSMKKHKKSDSENQSSSGYQFGMPISNKPWGTLHFYERGKQVHVHNLIENEIKIDHTSIFGEWYKSEMPFGSKIENLRDWVVILSNIFSNLLF
jgi:hypothetical protein